MTPREELNALRAQQAAASGGDTPPAMSPREELEALRAQSTAEPAPSPHAIIPPQKKSVMGLVKNLATDANDTVESLYNLPGTVVKAAMHPVQTAHAVASQAEQAANVLTGGIQHVRDLSGPGAQGTAGRMDTTAYDKFANENYEKYGTVANALNTAYEHPLTPAITAAQFVNPAARAIGLDRLAGKTAAKVGTALTPKPTVPPPTVAALKTQAGDLYERAHNAGVIIKANSFNNFAGDLTKSLDKLGIDKDLHPRATAALNRIKEAAAAQTDVSLPDLEILRKIGVDAADAGTKSDKMLSRRLLDGVNDYAEKLDPSHIVAGDAPRAVAFLNKARSKWKDSARGETIDKLIEKAKQNAGALNVDLDGALRNEFKKLANNERGISRFSEPQRQAIRKVAYGTGPVHNTMNFLGKVIPKSPTQAITTGTVGTVAKLSGLPVSFPLVAGVGTVGLGSKIGSTLMTAKNARLASELARGGSKPASAARSAAYKKIQARRAARQANP